MPGPGDAVLATEATGPSPVTPAAAAASAEGAPVDDAPPDDADAFPIDAFILPEDADHRPGGADAAAGQHTTPLSKKLLRPLPEDRAARLADRLEAIARRLRVDGPAALSQDLESHDRFDALLAGVLAGYLAAGDD
ncbi:MAG TPA: hypothetical protein VF158_09295 [Longimicrobiales bacterium]